MRRKKNDGLQTDNKLPVERKLKVYLDQVSLNEIIFYKFSIIYAMLTCEEYVDNLMSIKNIYQLQNQLIFYQDIQRVLNGNVSFSFSL